MKYLKLGLVLVVGFLKFSTTAYSGEQNTVELDSGALSVDPDGVECHG